MEKGMNSIFLMAEIDGKLHQLRRTLAQFPHSLAEARRQLDAEQLLLDELQNPWDEWSRQIGEKEATIAVALDTIDKFEEHMARVTTQKEYMAARKQVDDARRLNTQLQEEILRNQVKQEEIKPQLEDVRKRHNSVLEAFQEQEAKILAEKKKIDREVSRCEGKIGKLAADLGEREWSYYERLVKAGKTPAIVQVVAGTCEGCKMTIPPQSYNMLIAAPEKFYTCAHCNRIIFYKPPEPAAGEGDDEQPDDEVNGPQPGAAQAASA